MIHTMALLSCGSSGGGSGGGSSYYGRAVVFGGTSQHGTQTVAFNDLYVMDVMAASVDAGLALRWTRVVVVGRGGSPVPSPRSRHAMAAAVAGGGDDDQDRVLVIGGSDEG
jgi:hypothetical protein